MSLIFHEHAALLLMQPAGNKGNDFAESTSMVIIIVTTKFFSFIVGEVKWMKSPNSILQLETTFPSGIILHFTVTGIIFDMKTTKQELARLSSAPQQIRGLALFASFIKNHGVLRMNTGKAHLFVTYFCLQSLVLNHQHFKNTTSGFSGTRTNCTGTH